MLDAVRGATFWAKSKSSIALCARGLLGNHCSQYQQSWLELAWIQGRIETRTILIMATEREDAGRFVVHDAHFDGKRFVVRADVKLTAFLKLEAAIWAHSLGRTFE